MIKSPQFYIFIAKLSLCESFVNFDDSRCSNHNVLLFLKASHF